jgi:hypothetical protein
LTCSASEGQSITVLDGGLSRGQDLSLSFQTNAGRDIDFLMKMMNPATMISGTARRA